MDLQRESVNVVAIEIKQKCIKMDLPNGHTVDFLPDIFEEILKWLQVEAYMLEAGGFLVGYRDSNSGNVSIDGLSQPYPLDIRNRIQFIIRDPQHRVFLNKSRSKKSFYMGVWHTHPQIIPEPSSIDWQDWRETVETDITACEYVFFLIAGTKGARVWVGDLKSKKITEIFECEKEGDLYKKAK